MHSYRTIFTNCDHDGQHKNSIDAGRVEQRPNQARGDIVLFACLRSIHPEWTEIQHLLGVHSLSELQTSHFVIYISQHWEARPNKFHNR
jgi:hypothetical protein